MPEVIAPELYAPLWKGKGRTPERDEYLREHYFIDPAILADALGLSPRFVVVYMRKLGLRSCERDRRSI